MNIIFIFKRKIVYSLAALIPVTIFIALVISVSHAPYLGLGFERTGDKWYVVSVDDTIHSHKHDDLVGAEIVEIAGKKIEADTLEQETNARKNKEDTQGIFATAKYFAQHIKTGQAVTLAFSNKGGALSSIEITPVPYPPGKYLFDNAPLFITAFLTLFVGLFLIFKRPDNEHARMIYIISLLISMQCLLLSVLYLKNPGYDFSYFMLSLAVFHISIGYFLSSMAYFLLIFPNKYPLADNKLFVSFIFLLPLLELYLFFVHMIYPLYITYIISLCSFSLIMAAYKYISTTSPDLRAQMKTIILSIVLAFIIALVLFFLPIILVGKSIVAANWIMCVAVLFPVFTAVAIMRYKLMDIDTLFDNTIIYTFTVLILAALDILIISLLTGTMLSRLDIPEPVAVIFAVWIVVFAYIPVRNFVQRIIAKFLKRELYDINQVSLSLSQQMLSASDKKSAFEKAAKTINDTLHPKGLEYVLLDKQGDILTGDGLVLKSADISSYTKPVSLFETGSSQTKLPDSYSGGALVPVVGTKGHMGYFILQSKHSQRLYGSEDIKLLSIIASQLALTLEAIQYKKELRKNKAESEKEKERLIKDIHDGLGGSLSNINILSQKGSQGSYPEEVKSLFSTLSDLSRESLFEMRNLYNIIEKKEIEWDVVIMEMKNFGIFMLEPHKIVLSFRYGLANGAPHSLLNLDFVNIYKIYKEALSNIVKYSNATRVDINMDIREDRLILSIKDNGIGLQKNMPAPESGRGLKNMQDRAAEIGGELKITSDNGVLIYFEKIWQL